MPNDRFDLHAGAERHLRIAGNLPKHLAEKLLDENKQLRARVAEMEVHQSRLVPYRECENQPWCDLGHGHEGECDDVMSTINRVPLMHQAENCVDSDCLAHGTSEGRVTDA